MLINCDAKALEIVTCAYLSQDPVLLQEIIDDVDIHSVNQKRFGLPERRIAKIFVFRLIYGGGAYSYAHDPDFSGVSSSEKFWQKIIDEFYDKYKGIAKWHTSLMQTVTRTGRLVMPTGRIYCFHPKKTFRGVTWPRTQVLNYPVQGLGADLMSLARIDFYKKLDPADGLLASSVHDSVVVDAPIEKCYNIMVDLKNSMEAIPKLFEERFKVVFNLPMRCEISYGYNKKDMEVWDGVQDPWKRAA